MARSRRMEGIHTGISFIGDWYHGPAGVEVVKVVAVEGGADDWAAYAENDFTRARDNTDEIIASDGHKLKATEATEIFPEWANRWRFRD